MSLTLIGLVLLALAWVVQLYYVWKGNLNVQSVFVGIYSIGVLLLVIDAFQSNLNTVAIINAIVLAIAILVLLRLARK